MGFRDSAVVMAAIVMTADEAKEWGIVDRVDSARELGKKDD